MIARDIHIEHIYKYIECILYREYIGLYVFYVYI